MRIAEALALRPKDLDPAKGTIRVLRGKGSKARTIGMDPEAWAILQRWIDRRTQLGVNGHHPLTCTLKGQPLKTAYVRSLLPRLARKAGIEKAEMELRELPLSRKPWPSKQSRNPAG